MVLSLESILENSGGMANVQRRFGNDDDDHAEHSGLVFRPRLSWVLWLSWVSWLLGLMSWLLGLMLRLFRLLGRLLRLQWLLGFLQRLLGRLVFQLSWLLRRHSRGAACPTGKAKVASAQD